MSTARIKADTTAPVTVLKEVAIPRLLTAEQTADILGVSKTTLSDWRHQRRHLEFTKFGGRVMYDAADIAAYINRSKQKVSHD